MNKQTAAATTTPAFEPPRWLRNPHLQSILASTGPRKLAVHLRSRALKAASRTVVLDSGDGVRLQGEYAECAGARSLVIMIHGWLGCADSLYLLSAGSQLFARGHSVFRLNLRDHGDTAHLNRELFNSTRINEVVNAVRAVQQQFAHERTALCGYSLGGNFSLRVALRAPQNGIRLDRVIAVCPVINPQKTNRNLHEGPRLYHEYFRRKWRSSLLKKLEHFPEYDYATTLSRLRTLDDMNAFFVPNYTAYRDVPSYLCGYAIGGDVLKGLTVPCHIISSADDPVILAEDLKELPTHPRLTVELTRYGGHCGYIENARLHSWIDRRVLQLVDGTDQRNAE